MELPLFWANILPLSYNTNPLRYAVQDSGSQYKIVSKHVHTDIKQNLMKLLKRTQVSMCR